MKITFLHLLGALLGALFGVAILGLLAACHPYTAADLAGDLATENTCILLFTHESRDGGDPFDRALARGCVCSTQGNLSRHDAGRALGPITCVQKREP